MAEQSFSIEKLMGCGKVEIIFLPGSCFDLVSVHKCNVTHHDIEAGFRDFVTSSAEIKKDLSMFEKVIKSGIIKASAYIMEVCLMEYFPDVVQVIPHEDFTVSVYFSDGKIDLYDIKPFLHTEVFSKIKDIDVFMGTCTILNDTLAWDIAGDRNESECIDIDPDTLYNLPESEERIA